MIAGKEGRRMNTLTETTIEEIRTNNATIRTLIRGYEKEAIETISTDNWARHGWIVSQKSDRDVDPKIPTDGEGQMTNAEWIQEDRTRREQTFPIFTFSINGLCRTIEYVMEADKPEIDKKFQELFTEFQMRVSDMVEKESTK